MNADWKVESDVKLTILILKEAIVSVYNYYELNLVCFSTCGAVCSLGNRMDSSMLLGKYFYTSTYIFWDGHEKKLFMIQLHYWRIWSYFRLYWHFIVTNYLFMFVRIVYWLHCKKICLRPREKKGFNICIIKIYHKGSHD